MEFAVLGPVSVRQDGRELPLGGPKQRALLAILLLNANEAVSRDRLIDGLWGERPPATAAHTLDNYISRLRKVLGDDRLTRRPPGYALRLERGELDLDRFEQLVALGREQLVHEDEGEAAATLRGALALWRGTALADVLYEPFAAPEAERLEEKRLSALEERIEADLASGCSAELVAELERLLERQPFRERLVGQLMLALYRSGQQAKALEEYRIVKRRLAEELGLEPGPLLRKLEQRILEQDPSLEVAAPAQVRQPWRKWSRRRLVALGLVAAALAASAGIGIALGTGGTSASSVRSGASQVVALNLASGAPSRGVPFAGAPAALAEGSGSLWLADPDAGTVSRLDLAARAVIDRIPVGGNTGALAAGGGSVWAASVPGDSVTRIDPETGTVTQTVPLGSARAGALAYGDGRLWIADITDNSLIGLDPASGLVRRTLALHLRPTALAIVHSAIWVADYNAGSIAEVDLRTGQTVVTVHVGNGPTALATGRGALWVVNALDSTVSRVDLASGSVVATIPVGSRPAAIAVAGGSVWVANQYSATVSRIDPDRDAVTRTTPVGGPPTALAEADGRIWVGVRPLVQHRGGTLVLLHTRPISIDPALHFDLLPLVSQGLTRDGLVTYNHVPGAAGIQLVPDLAVSLPLPTDGGTTYTFRLRPRIRYSDGRPVRAADFRRAIERIFLLPSQGRSYFANVVGADACERPGASSCDLSSGIVTDDAARTVTFHLRAPDPDFLTTLTFNILATPLPPGTPLHDVAFDPLPGTGPYKIVSANRREIRYVRNPFFREWSHAAQPEGNPDEIVMRFGLTPEQEVREIEAGRADWMADNLPARLLPVLRRSFAGRQHGWTLPTTDFFHFNTTRPPFDDVRVRQALNLAIDRRAIVRIYGGRDLATPTCQVLPPGVPGNRRYCPYTRKPGPAGTWTGADFARAQHLVAASGTRGTPVTVWGWTDHPTISPRVIRYTAAVLRRLGYPAHVRLVSHGFFAHPSANAFRNVQVIADAWGDTPYGFFVTWFSCKGANDHGWFCDPRIDREVLRAQALKATRPRAAASLWARIDHELVDRAVWAPLINEHGIDFVSARVRNYQFHSYWGLIADQLWIR